EAPRGPGEGMAACTAAACRSATSTALARRTVACRATAHSASTTSLREHELDQVLRVCSQPLAGHPVSITDCTRRRPLGAPDLVELPPSSWSCGTSASWAGAPTR